MTRKPTLDLQIVGVWAVVLLTGSGFLYVLLRLLYQAGLRLCAAIGGTR